MITVRTSPAYVNRVRQDWTANGGVYGDGGVYAIVPSNDPFAQLGATLDLTFAGVPTDQLTAATADGYSINLNLSSDIYQIAAQYVVWQSGVGMASVNFADIITFTRASTATYFDATGTLQSAAINEARFDYNPATLAAQGLLIEEARTNSIRNNTMVGASAGVAPTNWLGWNVTTNGVTIASSAAGTENGIAYIDVAVSGTCTLTGTAQTPSFETATQVAATVGQTWTDSVYWTLISGSLGDSSFNVRLTEADSGGASLTSGDSAAVVPAVGALRSARYTLTRTLTNASTAFLIPRLRFGFVNGSTYSFTLRIGLPQLEQGAFATSVIPTTTTALTRSADVASVNTLSPWWNASEGTFYVEGSAGSLANSPIFVMPHDGTSNNYLNSPVLTTAGLARLAGVVGGAPWTNVNTANSTTANTTFKSASTFKAGDQAICLNAGTVATGVNASVPVVTTVKLGDWRTSGNNINGYLRRVTYYPRRLSNADLQTITA